MSRAALTRGDVVKCRSMPDWGEYRIVRIHDDHSLGVRHLDAGVGDEEIRDAPGTFEFVRSAAAQKRRERRA